MADRTYPIFESELKELELKSKWFDYLASRLDNAQLKLSFGGMLDIYMDESTPEFLIKKLEQTVSFEEYSDGTEDEDNVDSETTD